MGELPFGCPETGVGGEGKYCEDEETIVTDGSRSSLYTRRDLNDEKRGNVGDLKTV
jgi:hypothetical protein